MTENSAIWRWNGVALLCAAVATIAGCGSATTGEPKTLEAATAAAQEKSDRFASGDFAGEWLLFSGEIKNKLSRDDYVHYAETCKTSGPSPVAEGVRMDNENTAVVRFDAKDVGITFSRTMVYEDGQWVQAPTDDWYTKPVDQIIADDIAKGACKESERSAVSTTPSPPSNAAELQPPVQTSEEFNEYISRVEVSLKRSCFQVELSQDTQCMVDAEFAARTLRELASRLPVEYPKTQAAALNSADEFEHWWQVCMKTAPNTVERRECIVYMPRQGQLLDVQFAWGEERRALGLG